MTQPWAAEVFAFWFSELDPRDWFSGRAEVDALVRRRFSGLYARLVRDPPSAGRLDAEGHVATVIVFDQFPRNLFRESAAAFATDRLARNYAAHALEQGLDRTLAIEPRQFLYLPFMHSEDREDQARSVRLFASLDRPDLLAFAEQHHGIVDRFGRFPHRNASLGRVSTEAEVEFLKSWPGFV